MGVQVGLKSPSRDLWYAIFTPAVSRPASNQRICCYDTRECSFPQSGPLSNNRVIFLRSRLISALNNKRMTLQLLSFFTVLVILLDVKDKNKVVAGESIN